LSGKAAVELEGLSVSYQLAGDGPALVLLHGFSYDSRAWRPQIEGLSDQFTVIAWDAPGAGQSADPPDTFGISDWADCLEAFLAAIKVERPMSSVCPGEGSSPRSSTTAIRVGCSR
jgi:pimeloyl-ACP methyl ester carboxylesterase